MTRSQKDGVNEEKKKKFGRLEQANTKMQRRRRRIAVAGQGKGLCECVCV